MFRNIIMQAIYQIVVLMVFLIYGDSIFNLPFDKDTPFYVDEKYVESHPDAVLYEATNKCYLYTILFQTFVFMQIFSLFNARLLGDKETNIFKGITRNYMFIFIVLFIFVMQMCFVNFL